MDGTWSEHVLTLIFLFWRRGVRSKVLTATFYFAPGDTNVFTGPAWIASLK